MSFICINCGYVNNNEDLLCVNCNTQVSEVEYSQLINYARRAVYYGYTYRIEYEKQVAKHNEVKIKYSLLQPDQWYEWLAMAALSGAVGTYATDLVKYVAKQILKMFDKKAAETDLNKQDQTLVKFLSNSRQLNKFSIYVIAYYNGLPEIDKRVEEAIIEEEMADVASEDMRDEFESYLLNFNPDNTKNNSDMWIKIAEMTGRKRREKPSIEQTRLLLKALKQDLRQAKKSSKKKRQK